IGRSAEALAVVNRVAEANSRATVGMAIRAETQAAAPLSMLLGGTLRRRSLLILSVWFLVSLSYYGVFVWLPSQLTLHGHGFVRGQGFLGLVALAQLPGYALAAYGVERWGRRPTLTAFLILGALGCALFVAASSASLIAAALLLMSFAFLGAWG